MDFYNSFLDTMKDLFFLIFELNLHIHYGLDTNLNKCFII